jgi:hypothetical protein
MPLVKGHHEFENFYTQLPNDWLRDQRLSFKARGLMAYLMSNTEGWSLTVHQIAKKSIEGKDSIRSAIVELELLGYLRREQSNDNGRFGEVTWTTSDPAAEPLPENPPPENPPLKKNIDKKNIIKNREREAFDEFWKTYPKKQDKGLAERSFRKALSFASAEDIIEGAARYASDPNLPEPRYIKNPSTWLNAKAWENGPLPERGSRKYDNQDIVERWKNELS